MAATIEERLDRILSILERMEVSIRKVTDYIDTVTSKDYIEKSQMTNLSINVAADILVEGISPEIKALVTDMLKGNK